MIKSVFANVTGAALSALSSKLESPGGLPIFPLERTLRVKERGQLAVGYFADIVVFDPKTIAEHATYEQPHQISVGVIHVLVNGIPVVSDSKVTGAKPGRIVRGPGYRR